ncbi:MAG: radical SAM protein [Deltaproteobacteria bacterium]|nr:radical SAM protein [Deltaproteobacteria bacterium]
MSFYEMSFELTNKCNLSCLHCLRDKTDMRSFISVELFESILKQAKAYNLKHIAFTGGEPTLHPHFAHIIDTVVQHGYTYHFVTNAWNFLSVWKMLNDPHFPGRIGKLSGVSISLDGSNEKTHDYIRGKGSFKKILQAISILKIKGIDISVQITVNKKNFNEIEQMAVLASELGLKRLFYAHLEPTTLAFEQDLVLSPGEYREAEKRVEKLKKIMKIEINFSLGHYEPLLFFQCRALTMYSPNIDYKGRLSFCCQISGYTGAHEEELDVIADLNTVSLFDAHKMWADAIHTFNLNKIDLIKNKQITELDYFPCFYCSKYFGKIDWMEAYKNDPWAADFIKTKHSHRMKKHTSEMKKG